MRSILCAICVALVVTACSSSTSTSQAEPPAEAPQAESPSAAPLAATATAVVAPTATAGPTATVVPTPALPTPEPTVETAPSRPSSGENTGTDENPAWLGRVEMRADGLELVWSTGEVEAAVELHRFHVDALDDPQTVALTAESLVYDGPELALIDTDIEEGAKYMYVLRAELDTGQVFRRFSELHAVTDTTPPAPVGAVALTETDEGLLLSWQASSDNYQFARYAIRRSINGEQSVYYGTGWTIDQTSFLDNQLPEADTITYEVAAVDFHGNLSEASLATHRP